MKHALTRQYPAGMVPMVGDEFEELVGDIELIVRVVELTPTRPGVYEAKLECLNSAG